MKLQLFALGFAGVIVAATAHAAPMTDTQIRQAIIRQSIASYPGNCPCPYNTARNGSRCGARSAYNRAGGYAPMCFPSDVSKAQVEEYRRAHGSGAQ
jgi:hypothetical protein